MLKELVGSPVTLVMGLDIKRGLEAYLTVGKQSGAGAGNVIRPGRRNVLRYFRSQSLGM